MIEETKKTEPYREEAISRLVVVSIAGNIAGHILAQRLESKSFEKPNKQVIEEVAKIALLMVGALDDEYTRQSK